jgi:inosine/xanthosine triphosphate pyrophosphatase family protein
LGFTGNLAVDDIMKKLYLASSSPKKLQQYLELVQAEGYILEHLSTNLPEIQSVDLDKVAALKLRAAVESHEERPCFVDDTGLLVPELDGFPGALLKPVLEAGGLRLLDKLTRGVQREGLVEAILVTVIHLHTGAEALPFRGVMTGVLDFRAAASLDAPTTAAIFRPEGDSTTLADRERQFGPGEYRHRVAAIKAALAALRGGLS